MEVMDRKTSDQTSFRHNGFYSLANTHILSALPPVCSGAVIWSMHYQRADFAKFVCFLML